MSKYRYLVSHPEFRAVEVTAEDPGAAIKAACEVWQAATEWTWLAGYCTVDKLGTARRPTCRRCYARFGRAGEADGLCPTCRRAEELHRREMARTFWGYESRKRRERM